MIIYVYIFAAVGLIWLICHLIGVWANHVDPGVARELAAIYPDDPRWAKGRRTNPSNSSRQDINNVLGKPDIKDPGRVTRVAPEITTPVELNVSSKLGGDTPLATRREQARLRNPSPTPNQLISISLMNVNLRFTNLAFESSVMGGLETDDSDRAHEMRCDLLSQALRSINDEVVENTTAIDPKTKEERPTREVYRDALLRWGNEVILQLWKLYRIHCRNLSM